MAKRKNEPEIKLPKIEQLPSGAWHTRVYLDGRRTSITRDTYDECLRSEEHTSELQSRE